MFIIAFNSCPIKINTNNKTKSDNVIFSIAKYFFIITKNKGTKTKVKPTTSKVLSLFLIKVNNFLSKIISLFTSLIK